MSRSFCKYKDKCSAPLCPLEKESLTGIWYPDEEICKLREQQLKNDWIKTQKKIVKKTTNPNFYFNLKMLNQNCVIKKGIKGISPNKPEANQLERWLKLHPSKKELSKKEKEKLKNRFKKNVLKKGKGR